ncbi:hypothetical protein M6B38_182180 [Iris pallida]|uniref:Uncharacterized protein n=1 Tax=Iris pallida TaxID=29817 RepID=A0AAX6EMJ8_IRIPA|nr:hypothetical protein M6B38_182180 [Iris pallida]
MARCSGGDCPSGCRLTPATKEAVAQGFDDERWLRAPDLDTAVLIDPRGDGCRLQGFPTSLDGRGRWQGGSNASMQRPDEDGDLRRR